MPGPVITVDYDPAWPAMYDEEQRLISDAIGPWVLAIEHVGSTAVPGLGAKPIIDTMVGVRSLDDAQQCIPLLAPIGYIYQPDDTIPERVYFNKGPAQRHRHLHITVLGGDFWRRHLLFRDYLRRHPETAQAYERLKRDLAAQYGSDRIGYTDAKTDFIRSVEAKAEAEVEALERGTPR